jgi:3-oxosteroid 1-dehydrogenase
VPDREITKDIVVVGSGGGLAGAVTAAAHGLDTLVLEKEPLLGGSTAMSGGVLWLPNNPLMQEEGVPDSFDDGMAYFRTVVGDAGPASSDARRSAYIRQGAEMVQFLRSAGLRLMRCEGYSDYYAGVRGIEGGKPRGRSLEPEPYDGHELGEWYERLRPGMTAALGIAVLTQEAAKLQLLRKVPAAWKVAAKVGARTALGRARRQALLTNGAALVARTLRIALDGGVEIWTEAPLVDLLVEDGRVVGVVATHQGDTVHVRARRGVLLSSGGFARNAEMRERYGKHPASTSWTIASPGDTGEVIELAMKYGADVDYMDEAWWNPASVTPAGVPSIHQGERAKPHSMIVNVHAKRYFNEACAYMEAGRQMYANDGVPSWLIVDSFHRDRYLFGFKAKTPQEWLDTGYMKKADTIEELARQCELDPATLRETVERFNEHARNGIDPDFHKGEGNHERYQGDPTHLPNPCVGPVDKAPFFAVKIFPGDVGTSGGVLTDEHARVLDQDHRPIPGLYAAGNCTASVMGRTYPGAGASIGASFVFSYIAAKHAAAATT